MSIFSRLLGRSNEPRPPEPAGDAVFNQSHGHSGGDPDRPLIVGAVPNPAEGTAGSPDPFSVKIEHVLPPDAASDPFPTESISFNFDKLVVPSDAPDISPTGDDVVVDGRIITGEPPHAEAETVHLYLKSNSEDIQDTSQITPGFQGAPGSGDAAVSDSFGFGVEREMKESGEKGGTEDINIGVGELHLEPGDALPAKGEIHIESFSWGQSNTVSASAERSGFGVEREMKESGEKGGTEDINIGVGELQESGPGALASEGEDTHAYYEVKLENARVTSYSLGASSDAATPEAPDELAAGIEETEAGKVKFNEFTIKKTTDVAPAGAEDADEGSTLESLEPQEPAAVGRAIAGSTGEGPDGDHDDLDLDDLDV